MPGTTQLPILGPGISGKSRAVTAQKRQNIYMEVKAETDKARLVAYGTPGLALQTSLGNSPIRGIWWYQPGNFLLAVAGSSVYEIDANWTITTVGAINSSSGNVSMSDNGSQIIIVDGQNGYVYQKTTPNLTYAQSSTTVTVQETSSNRTNGDSVQIQVNSGTFTAGTYTVIRTPVVSTALVTNATYKIVSIGTSDFTAVGAATNTVGTIFTATGTTAGTGTATLANQWQMTAGTATTTNGTLNVLNNFRQITDPDFPGGTTVVFNDSYFIVNAPNTREFYISGQYDAFSWNGLNFASKEAYTDNLSAVAIDNGNLALLGVISYEYWQDVGAYPFPYLRIAGSPNDFGVVSPWTIARVNGAMFFLARARRGGISVVNIQNYLPIVVSSPDLDYLFSQYPDPEDAVAFGYRQNGHEFYQISFQTAGVTWLFDATSNMWSQLVSYNDTRHFGNHGTQFNFQNIVTDYRNGNIYALDPSVYTDNGFPIVRELITPHFFEGNSYNKLHIYRLRLDMEQGVGTSGGQGQNPQIMLQISRDGGFTWGQEMWTNFGNQGEFLKRAEWRRLGVSRNYVFKFRISDPVKVVFISAAAYATEAQK